MALVFMTGFELDVNDLYWRGSYADPTGSQKRSGTYSASRWYSGGGWLGTQLVPSSTELFVQCCYRRSSSGGVNPLMSIANSTTSALRLYWDASHCLYFQIPAGTFAGTTGLTVMPLATWACVEVRLKLHATDGIAEVRIDGSTELYFTGKTDYIATMDRVGFYSPTDDVYLDDIVINDKTGSSNTSWPNGQHVVYLPPTGDGTLKQWTPTPAGLTHYTAVDEVVRTTTDYLSSLDTSSQDFLSLANLPAGATAVSSIQVICMPRKMSTTTSPSTLRLSTLSAGVTTWTDPKIIGLGCGFSDYTRATWDANPNTGQRWTVDEINGLQIGIKADS